MATEFQDNLHFAMFKGPGAYRTGNAFDVRWSEIVLASLRAAGIMDNMNDGTVPPDEAAYDFWLDKNHDPAILKAWDSENLAWMPVTYGSFFRLAAESSLDIYKDIIAGFANDVISQGNVPIYATVLGMPSLEIPVGMNAIRVNGYSAVGDGGGGNYLRVNVEPTHTNKFQTADGSWWEIAPSSLNFQGKDVLPTVGAAYIVDETYQVDAADENYILNGDFSVWHEGYMQTSLSENTNAMILAQWRAETVGTGTSINSIQKISGASGGLRFNAVFGADNGFAYVRQNLLGVRQFSGKQFTSVIDIEVDVACVVDFYVRMRINASDASVDRPLVVDTNELAISPGRKLVAVTFDCPDISSYIGVENYQNSLEYAFRVQGSSKTVDVKVYGATITAGRKLRAPTRATYIETLTVENACFEIGVAQINGFTATSGQKRLFTQYRSGKIRTPTVTIYDMAGVAGKVSTYDSAGTRTDGITPGVIINDDFGVGVVLISSTACGIAFRYAANAYP